MINNKLQKLIGLKKEEFDQFINSGQIQVQPARLIPTLKTGDEMALTSIFLSTIRLVKEFRDGIFKEIKLNRTGKAYYYTEASFLDLDNSRIDGLIIVVSKGVIQDAAFFEMKSKNNGIDHEQIGSYIETCKKLRVDKIVTISNEFVANPTISPIDIRVPKNIDLFHFSWTYLMTKGQLLLFNNDENIEDEDQVEIMRETLYYMENPISGVCGYSQMKPGWKETAENIKNRKSMKPTEPCIEDSVLSWYEEEKDMALLLSRKLGVLVKSTPRGIDSMKDNIKQLLSKYRLTGTLSIKGSVSDINIITDFERRTVEMSVKITPPLDKGSVGKISWMKKQIENCEKKEELLFSKNADKILISADVKFARENLKEPISKIDRLQEDTKDKEIQAFHVIQLNSFGNNFASSKQFVVNIENMIIEFYQGTVQNLFNWNRTAPRLN
jgi:hypothetical protein